VAAVVVAAARARGVRPAISADQGRPAAAAGCTADASAEDQRSRIGRGITGHDDGSVSAHYELAVLADARRRVVRPRH
jgi:hypothetical protein